MTGGQAFVLDLEERFAELYNPGLVGIERLTDEDKVAVQQLIYKHLENTESLRARDILADWLRFQGAFWKVKPRTPAAKPVEAKPPASTEAVISEKVVATNP